MVLPSLVNNESFKNKINNSRKMLSPLKGKSSSRKLPALKKTRNNTPDDGDEPLNGRK